MMGVCTLLRRKRKVSKVMFLFYQAITTCLPKITKTFHHRDSMRTTNAAVHLRRHTSPPPFTLILSSRDSISSLNFSIWNFFFIVAIVEKKMGAPKKSAARVSEDHDELVRVPLQAIMLADSFTTKLDLSLLNAPKLYVLLPLVNVPMIYYTLTWLESAGVEEVFVFCCAHAKQVINYLEKSEWFNQPNFTVTTYEARRLLGLGVSQCRTRVVSDTDTTPTLVITPNYVIFSNY
ncbi:putative protein-synthesizing GTPase [Medicago truncatula]|uniref:Uncharacterized protein n=1 Tax=Medicago truncatula TaxID=3880 RepID=A0A396HBC2_MEDTR|nr:putative protein-synthesizing GTPase [Medicago truncatula]